MKLRTRIDHIILFIVIILAITGWARPFHPTSENLNNLADEVV